MQDHERIWLEPKIEPSWEDRSWCKTDVWTGDPDYDGARPTEYVRADLLAVAWRAGAEAMRKACMNATLDETVDSGPTGAAYNCAIVDVCCAIRALPIPEMPEPTP